LLGNASPEAIDAIVLDTARPMAVASQSRVAVERGQTVTFDAAPSLDPNPAIASGVDPAGARWDFKDGTAPASGQRVSHVFAQTGTLLGELRVSDRAGNQSVPRGFTVTVTPRPGDTAAGSGVVGGITATNAAAFKVESVKVRARYRRSRLRGVITLSGSTSAAGELRARIARGTRTVARLTAAIRAGAFSESFPLPASLLPGRYRLEITGPGGSARSSLRLLPPREGVLASGRVRVSGARARAIFVMASQPVTALRRQLAVTWSQGARNLGRVTVRP